LTIQIIAETNVSVFFGFYERSFFSVGDRRMGQPLLVSVANCAVSRKRVDVATFASVHPHLCTISKVWRRYLEALRALARTLRLAEKAGWTSWSTWRGKAGRPRQIPLARPRR